MNCRLFRRSVALPLLLCSFAIAPLALIAQDNGDIGPPPILVIQREYLKPGKAGSLHDKTEAAFVQALANAKSTSHYFGMTSMSGPSRALYFSAFASLADWEKDNKNVEKDKALLAALDHASIADGELLSSYDQHVFMHRPELSLNEANLVGKRYFDIGRWEIKPGHEKEFEELVKMYMDGTKKAGLTTNWATYEIVYGTADGDVFLALTTRASLAEADADIANSKKFSDAVGEDGMNKIRELTRSAVKSQESNLFAINPKMSYVPESWVKGDDFWKVPVKKAEPKPAAAPAAKPTN